jgi:1-acyl-sn-glycerol-3-phosphate acyltransferase
MTAHSIENKKTIQKRYDHARLEPQRRFLRFLLKTIGFTLLAKIESVQGLENIPAIGPAILMINHMALIDPVVIVHIVPRSIVPLAKIEVYDYPVIGIFPKMWGVIPVRREEFDRRAVQQIFDVLRAREIVLIAPEGTRSPQLRQAKEGIAYVGSRSHAPILPVAIDGTIGFPALRGTRRWREAGARVTFGKPFRFRQELAHANRDQLHVMTEEAMYVLAELLPPHRRGVYADLSQATQRTLEWL